ncbi:CU044_5270 family protein [Streptosporangium sp. NPDC048047]|uniref:CU044_5270 family protein n=1 Tax=Streptosporangium sp. NPDC048047 TaxID=3155748 RepID=UPI00341B8497
MNEIELLTSLRDEVPHRPDVRAEEHRLLAEIRDGSPSPGGRPSRPAFRPRWGLALAGAGLAASAVVALQAGGTGGIGGTGEPRERPAVAGPSAGRPPSAAVVLENAALVAARAEDADIRPDRWVYRRESQHFPNGGLPTFETWTRMDGRKEALREEGGNLKIGDGEKGPTNPVRTQRDVDALPTDPDALLAHFRGMERDMSPLSICQPDCPAGTETDVKAFGAIGWYLKYGPLISPEKTAAMYRALARIPNVRIEENATDGDGRTGVGVVLDLGPAGKGYYILDARDYHYLGTKVVNGDDTAAMSVLGSGVVDEPGQIP